MEDQEKDVFYVVRKGDIVGVYRTLTDCPSLHSSSVCDPPISIYKGCCLTKETEKYLASLGLTNATHSISLKDVREDIFGRLTPCPPQLPPCKGKAIQQSFSTEEDTRGVEIEQDEGGSNRAISLPIDAFKKHVKLDDSLKAQAVPGFPTKHVFCILNFAGSSSGNPGKAGAGAILRSEDGTLVCRLREGLGTATYNEAEFQAIILGLKDALKKGFTRIHVLGNSKLVCRKMLEGESAIYSGVTGVYSTEKIDVSDTAYNYERKSVQDTWKIKDEEMSILCKEAMKLKEKFFSFQINHVLKEQNSEAVAEADLAIYFADGQVHEACDEN